MHGFRAVTLMVGMVILAQAGLPAQTPVPDAGRRHTGFAPLRADPQEPGFFINYLWANSQRLGPQLGAVGLGQTFSLFRSGAWEFGLGGAVFSQFNMAEIANDLINTDYVLALPVTYRDGALAARVRVYHQSSHLGDEYMIRTGTERVHLSLEGADVVVAHEVAPWRLYGGAAYAFTRFPSDLASGWVRAGLEYSGAQPILRFGRLTAASLVAGLDVAAGDFRGPAWSFVGGLEFGRFDAAPRSGARIGVLLRTYVGPAPYGQFYRDRLTFVGVGLSFGP